MRRFLVTLIVVVTLAVTFRVYSAVLNPLTEIRESQHPLVEQLEADLRTPAAFEKQAVEVFPEYEWTHRADQTWQMAEKAYLYFNQFERVQTTGNSIQISPVAIFWHDPKRPGEKPFRILAERAQVKFQNAFFDRAIALSNANPGRIVWASLEGAVHIDGPDGLSIDGQNFKFDEESTQLYSDHEIRFAFGPTPQDQRVIRGTADQLQLLFTESHESILGKDMPRVGELAQVLLRRNVSLDMSYVQKDEPRIATIRSAGSLQYDVLRHEITLDDHVHIVHTADPQGTSRKDAIDCSWLQIQLDSTASADEENKKKSGSAAFDGLTFRSMRAQGSDNGHGSRLKVTSDDQQLVATMQDLAYDSTRRRAVLIDQKQVEIHRGNMRFVCPQIGLQHSVDNQIEYLECRGAGQMDVIPERPGDPPVVARWEGRVQVQPDPEEPVHQVRLEDQALLGVPGQFGIAADSITLWVDMKRAQSVPAATGKALPGPTPGTADQKNMLAGPLPLKRARAENNVLLDSLLLKVERSSLIEMVIHPGLIEDPAKNSPASGQRSIPDAAHQQPWVVEADSLHVDLLHDSGKAALDVREIVGAGRVRVLHDAEAAPRMGNQPVSGPLQLQGESLLVTNQGGIRQLLTVRGELNPQGETVQNARVSMGSSTLWGGQITLAREENRVDVPGPGGFSVPLTQGLNGKPTKAESKLDVVWQEGMSFDGLVARFWGKVTAAVPGEEKSITRLLCEDLSATLNHRISFAEPNRQPADLTISEIEARHHVVVESIEYALNQLAAVRSSTLAAFKVNLQSGNFQGDGPGAIDSWSMGNALKFSPGESPQANQPARPSDTRWRYSSVRFAGNIEGNINRNDATLRERVEVLTAPVDKAKTKFQREQLSDSSSEAPNAVWMKCHQMRIIQKAMAGKAEKTFEVYATGDTELEGHVFRAVADELTYNEQYGLFTLRGLGKEAQLYHQQQPGAPVNPFSASQIKFVPVKREIVIDGSSGISGSY